MYLLHFLAHKTRRQNIMNIMVPFPVGDQYQ